MAADVQVRRHRAPVTFDGLDLSYDLVVCPARHWEAALAQQPELRGWSVVRSGSTMIAIAPPAPVVLRSLRAVRNLGRSGGTWSALLPDLEPRQG